MRNRTAGRELALKYLFMLDLRGDDAREELTPFLEEAATPNEAKVFAKALVVGYLDSASRIDERLKEAAENWSLPRMAAVDRNILRIAAFELLEGSETPAKVAINEAIELGKKYGSSKTAAFVNGILDRIRRTLETTGDTDAPTATNGETSTT